MRLGVRSYENKSSSTEGTLMNHLHMQNVDSTLGSKVSHGIEGSHGIEDSFYPARKLFSLCSAVRRVFC